MNNFEQTLPMLTVMSLSSPLQLIKLRLQTTKELVAKGTISKQYKNVTHCLKTVIKKQGVKSLWKGSGITLLRLFPNQMVINGAKNWIKKYLPYGAGSNVAAGIFGGWVAATIMYPLDILRINISNNVQKNTSILTTSKNIFRQKGFKFFYKGFLNTLIGAALFRGTFNGTYDSTKNYSQNMLVKSLCAYMSAVTASLLSYPLDLIRKRRIMNTSDDNVIQFTKQIFKEEGVRGFFKGSKLVGLQSVIGAGVLMFFDSQKTRASELA